MSEDKKDTDKPATKSGLKKSPSSDNAALDNTNFSNVEEINTKHKQPSKKADDTKPSKPIKSDKANKLDKPSAVKAKLNELNDEIASSSETKASQKEPSKNLPKPDIVSEPQFDAPKMPKLNKPKKSGGAGSGRFWFMLLLVLIALAGAGWSSYQQYLAAQSWSKFEANMVSSTNQQNLQITQSQTRAENAIDATRLNQQTINAQAQQIAQLKDALTATQERVLELSGRQQQDWLLAEAEYLIKLAEYKITLEKDKNTAIGLLKTADQKVSEIADNRLLDLRQTIAQDVGNLQLVVAPDIGGITASLSALSDQVTTLDLKALAYEEVEPVIKELAEQDKSFTWNSIYQNFLKDFVTIKDHSEPVKPLMTPENRANLNANIQLALQKAQIALVRAEQQLFEQSLKQALNWVETFFVDNQASQTVVENLKQLMVQRVVIDMPKQLASKTAIQGINQQRLYNWLEAEQPIENSLQENSSQKSRLQESNLQELQP